MATSLLKGALYFFFLMIVHSTLLGQAFVASKKEIVLSAIKGRESKTDTVILRSLKGAVKIKNMLIKGDQAMFFKISSAKPQQIAPGKSVSVAVIFSPSENFIGVAHAVLQINDVAVDLSGLSTKGLEGENEAPMVAIVEALGYKINVGWNTLANTLKPQLQGEELAPALFKKAADGPVEMIPVARYSPDFALNFGYYINTSNGPLQHMTGILSIAREFPEHQTLFPGLASGKTSFDPGNSSFGFYAASPSHTLYTEDLWNTLFYPTHAAHAMRIYPVKNRNGAEVKNTYLVCMEEAANGDYNDYVFLVKNIQPHYIDQQFTSLFNGKNLDGWYTWFQGKGKNSDSEKIFSVQEDGTLHDIGKNLGYIMTEKSFGNFHFILEFKWGERRWPPRENNKRDSGICYNIPDDDPDQIWPQSIECQIQEGDVGDFWLLEYSTIQVDGKQNPPLNHSQIIKKKDGEKPYGEWNTVEVISFNGKCAHIVNGVLVNIGENASLIGGRILLQSEYAELYYRNVRLREL
jgi:hypothetical protein